MKALHLATIALGLAALSVCARASEPPSKRAVLIGISNYATLPPLKGADRDAELMASVLRGRFDFPADNIRVLTNGDATAENMRNAVTALTERTNKDDVVVVYFSGYGAQIVDQSGDELDGFDETLLPSDAGAAGGDGVTDDEFNKLLARLSERTSKLTVVLDSCFAATPSRGGASGRCILLTKAAAYPSMKGGKGGERSDTREPGARFSLMSAAQPGQIANESVLDSGPQGVFTYELAHALIDTPGPISFLAAMRRAQARVRSRFPTQEPLLDTPDPEAPVFHDASARSEFVAYVGQAAEGQVRITAGQFHGVSNGARYEAYRAGTTDFASAKPIATVGINRVAEYSSSGDVSKGGSVPVGSIVRLAAARESTRLSVWFNPDDAAKSELGKLREFLRRDSQILIVENAADAQLQVVRRDDGFAVLSGDLTPLNYGLKSGDDVHAAIRSWVRWFSVLRFSNPSSPLKVTLTLSREGSDQPLSGPVRPGEVLAYTVSNASSQPLLVQTLLLSSDGSIEVSRSGVVELPPGKSVVQKIGTFLPDNRRGVTDYVKVFASTRKVDLAPLTNPGSVVNLNFLAKVDWTSAQVAYELRRQTTRVGSFAVHRDRPAPSGKSSGPAGRESVCQQSNARDCITGQAITRDGTVMIVSTTFARSDPEDLGPGEAFQQAYEMRAQLKAERVEPQFEMALGEDLPGLEGRSGGEEANDPAAEKNKMWSLEYVKASAAWTLVRTSLGRPAGREAQGVRIAHLDTGYREHPESYFTDGDYTTILPKSGFDLVDGGDPYDTLSTSGTLPNPGHGTASGSVIVSAPGCQLKDGAQPCVTGVGLGAQLIPIRVHTSVVVFNQQRMADAIFRVAEGGVSGDPRLVSIAMGGPPSWALWRAVRAAERAGILIIAAAGNNVGFIVWPARFDSAIAAGAINVRCKPWSGTSEGSRVDISAPGESVWRAQFDRSQRNVIGMGSGTTFATATTTGAAALWIAKNRESDEYRQLVASGGLTEAFRRALKATAWRPVAGDANKPSTQCEDDTGWNDKRNGPGILDAERLVARPVDSAVARAATAQTLADLPLFATLYGRDPPLDQVAADYTALFPENARADIGQFEAEVMFHYASDALVRSTLDRIAGGDRSAADIARAREALQRVDLSRDLRRRFE